LYTCAWCSRNIPEGNEVFGLGAKLRPGIDFKDKQGTITTLFLTTTNKNVPVIVAGAGSDAQKEGEDLVFMVCSQECGIALKKALQKEIDLIDNITFP
jgi:hypothetical protein